MSIVNYGLDILLNGNPIEVLEYIYITSSYDPTYLTEESNKNLLDENSKLLTTNNK